MRSNQTGRWNTSHDGGGPGIDALEGHDLKQATATIFLCECGKAFLDVYQNSDAYCRHWLHLKEVREVHHAQRQEGNPFE